MKRILILTTIVFVFYNNTNAQRGGKTETKPISTQSSSSTSTGSSTSIPPKDTTSKAKAQINNFWKQYEKMKTHTDESNKQVVYKNCLNGCKTALNNTKMKDPNYNTSEMEKALTELENMYNGVADGKENERELGRITSSKLLMFFEPSGPFIRFDYSSLETDAETIQRVRNNDDSLKKYKQLADKFLSEPYDKSWYDQRLLGILQKAKGFQTPNEKSKWPSGLAVTMHHLEDPNSMWNIGTFTLVQIIKHEEAYFYAANALYPNQPTIQKALEWCKKAVAQNGTIDEVLAKIGKSNSDYLKKVKFPAAKVTDANLEADFKKIFNEQGWDEKITKVSIQSTDWVIDRNELTGVIVGRSKQAFIATKKPDGTCWVTEFWIFQDYNGSGYGNFRNGTGNSYRSQLDCANVK